MMSPGNRFSPLLKAGRIALLFPAFFGLAPCLRAQTAPEAPAFFYIDTIVLQGLDKTRPSLIFRELEFATGDSLPAADLPLALERNRLRLMNTGLFSFSELRADTLPPGNRLALYFRFVETWYVYPVPLFELVDRNFNVWWTEFRRSLKRVNYGLSWTHLNLSGRADVLKLTLNFGYSNRYEVVYERPWINRRQTLGLRLAGGFVRTHEVAYATSENKLLFHVNPDRWQSTRYYAVASMHWRPQLWATHSWGAEFRLHQVDDSLAVDLNSDYFLKGRARQQHLSLLYRFAVDRRNARPYPVQGWFAAVDLRQNGLLPSDDLHLFRAGVEYRKYFSFSPRLSLEAIAKGRVSLPRSRPPYHNNQALGYGNDLVRGYEFYVMDGLDYGLFKSSFHVQLLGRKFQLGRLMPLKAFRTLPLDVYFSVNNDLGYANDPYYAARNPLSNRLLWGYGFGIDIVAYYDKVIKVEWSWKDIGGGGLYLNVNMGF